MTGMPELLFTKLSMLPAQKQKVISIVRPKAQLPSVAQIMAEGSTDPASFISSDICEPASGPRKDQRGVVIPTRVASPLFPQFPSSAKVVKTSLAEL